MSEFRFLPFPCVSPGCTPGLRGPGAVAALLLACLCASSAARAESDEDARLKFTGFLTLTGGKVFNGNLAPDYSGLTILNGNTCPCYTADWANAGVYTDRFSLAPESRAGIQATYTLSPTLNLTGQVVTRGADPTPNIQWAYASYAPDKNWEFQLGRKRIPLYFYSAFQDVGLAYPWVSPPPELYGWETVNYNGASVRYKTDIGTTNLNVSAFIGREHVKDSLYQKLFYPGTSQVTWDNLIGADAELTHGTWTTRMVYLQADIHYVTPSVGLDQSGSMKAYG